MDPKAIVTGAYACARTLLDLAHKLIFDAVILSEKGAQEMLRAFDGFDPLFVALTCSWEEIEKRTLARGDRTLAEAEHGYRNARGRLCAHHTFDSTNASAEQIAAQLATSGASAVRPSPWLSLPHRGERFALTLGAAGRDLPANDEENAISS